MAKKLKMENNEMTSITETAFLESGTYSDEITFEFGEGKKLYVSKNFLTMVSPVFGAMFDEDHKFKESREQTVKMVDIKFEDFREFLLCTHPGIQKQVTDDTYYQLASIADKYQSQPIISRCKTVMEQYLKQDPPPYIKGYDHRQCYNFAYRCLLILHKADELNYDEIVQQCLSVIPRLGHTFFTGITVSSPSCHDPYKEERKQCQEAFQRLNPELKLQLCLNRLVKCKDDTTYK